MSELAAINQALLEMNRMIGNIEGTVTSIKEMNTRISDDMDEHAARIVTLEKGESIRTGKASILATLFGLISGIASGYIGRHINV